MSKSVFFFFFFLLSVKEILFQFVAKDILFSGKKNFFIPFVWIGLYPMSQFPWKRKFLAAAWIQSTSWAPRAFPTGSNVIFWHQISMSKRSLSFNIKTFLNSSWQQCEYNQPAGLPKLFLQAQMSFFWHQISMLQSLFHSTFKYFLILLGNSVNTINQLGPRSSKLPTESAQYSN